MDDHSVVYPPIVRRTTQNRSYQIININFLVKHYFTQKESFKHFSISRLLPGCIINWCIIWWDQRQVLAEKTHWWWHSLLFKVAVEAAVQHPIFDISDRRLNLLHQCPLLTTAISALRLDNLPRGQFPGQWMIFKLWSPPRLKPFLQLLNLMLLTRHITNRSI